MRIEDIKLDDIYIYNATSGGTFLDNSNVINDSYGKLYETIKNDKRFILIKVMDYVRISDMFINVNKLNNIRIYQKSYTFIDSKANILKSTEVKLSFNNRISHTLRIMGDSIGNIEYAIRSRKLDELMKII